MINPEETQKKVAYDLTIEYVRQSKILNNCYNQIPEKVEEINSIYKSFYNSLANKDIINR